ncbi:MAG: ASPIC/UnbV domain-containing protein, partial [Saprospiraceae bacterium]
PITTPFTNAVAHLANVWGDMDNDGDLDVMLTTDGNPSMRFYRNNGGTFGLSANAGTASNSLAGAALADYDNDGDLDIFVNGPTTARSLFRNDTVAAGRNWAQFTLEGTESNRSAIGATIWLKATIKGQPVRQIRQVLARNSFQSQSDLRQHFGLNDAVAIDSVRVLWPSGWVDNFTGLAANNFYKIVEGQSITMKLEEPSAATAVRFEVSPNPFASNFQVRFLPGFEADAEAVELFDSSGRLVAVQVLRSAGAWSVAVPNGLPTGAYFVRVRFRDGQAAVRQLVRN